MSLDSSTRPERDAPRRATWRKIGLLVAATALAVALLLLATTLYVPPVTTHVLNLVLDGRPLAPGTVLSAARMAPRGPFEWQLVGVRWVRGDTLLAAIDSVRVGLRVAPLMRRRIELRMLELSGGVVTDAAVVRRAPGKPTRLLTFADLLRGRFYSGPPLVVDRLVVRDARWSRRDPDTGRRSDVVLSELRARDVALRPGFAFEVENLVGHAGPADAPDSATVLRLVGGLADGRVEARTLRLTRGGNDFTGRGGVGVDARDELAGLALAGRARLMDLRALARFAPPLDPDGALTADVDLHGPRLDRVSGTAAVAADRARIAGLELTGVGGDLRFADGRGEGSLAATCEQAPVDLRGWARPFDRAPSYRLVASASRLPARLSGLAGWPAFAARNPNTTLELVAENAGDPDRVAHVSARVRGPAGQLDGTGRIALVQGGAWSVDRLAFVRLDLARLTGGGERSTVDGTLTASGHLKGARDSSITGELVLGPSRWGAWRITRGRVRADIEQAFVRGALDVQSDAGRIAFSSVEMRLDGDGAIRLEGGGFDDLDLARLTGQPSLPGRLTGTARGTGRGIAALGGPGGPVAALESGRTSGTLWLDLASSRLRDAAIDDGTVRVTLAGGQVEVEGALDSDAGQIALDGSARPFASPASVVVRSARFADLDLAAWTANPAFRSRLTGSLTGTAGGNAWDTALDLESSRVAGITLEGGQVRASGSGRQARASARLLAAGDSASLDGEVDLGADVPHGHVDATLPLGLLAGLAGRDTLPSRGAITASARFEGTDPATLHATGTLAGRGAVAGATLDTLLSRFELDQGTLRVDTLVASSNAGTATGSGTLALFDTTTTTPELALDLVLRDASRLKALLGADTLDAGGGALAVRVRGPVDARRVEARGNVRALTWNEWRLLGAEVTGEGTVDRRGRIAQAKVDGRVNRFHGFGTTLSGEAQGTFDDGQAGFDVDVGDAAGHHLHTVGTAVPDSTGARVALATVEVRDDSTRWRLARPAVLDVRADRVLVEDFELRSADGHVIVDGTVDRRGTQNLRVEARHVGIGSLARSFGRDGLDGMLDGTFALGGPASSPDGNGGVAVDLFQGGRYAGTLRSNAGWDGQQVRLAGAFTGPSGDSLAWTGTLPLMLSLAAVDSAGAPQPLRMLEGDVDVRLTAEHFPLAALTPFVDPANVGPLEGRLDLDARLRGSGRALSGNGRVDLAGGRVPLPGLGVTWSGIELRSRLEGDRLVLEQARVASDKGRLDLTGDVRFASAARIEPHVHAEMTRFMFVDTPGLRAVATGAVDVAGAVTRPVVSGKLTFLDSSFEMVPMAPAAAPASDVQLTAEDIRRMEEVFGFVDAPKPEALPVLYDAAELDLAIGFERDNWIRQRREPRFAVALDGDVRLKKEPGGETELFGRITPVPGRGFVEQFARSFDITGGELLLNGRPADHRVDLHAEYQSPSTFRSDADEVKIRLDVTGPPDKLKLTLSSDPSMSETEIVNYIATGRSNTPGVGDPKAQQSTGALAADIGMAGLTGGAQMAAQEAIGLDVLQVRFDALEGATLVAGRYVDPKVYVGFLQPLQYKDEGSPTSTALKSTRFEVEYAFQRWLVLNVKGESTELRSFLRVRHEY